MKPYLILLFVTIIIAGSVQAVTSDIWNGETVCGSTLYTDYGNGMNYWMLSGAELNITTTTQFYIEFLSGHDATNFKQAKCMICQYQDGAGLTTWNCVSGTRQAILFSGSRDLAFTAADQKKTSDIITMPTGLNNTANYWVACTEAATNGGYGKFGACTNRTKGRSCSSPAGADIDSDSFSGCIAVTNSNQGIFTRVLTFVNVTPTLSTNLTTAYNPPFNGSIDVGLTGLYWDQNTYCSLTINDTGLTCNSTKGSLPKTIRCINNISGTKSLQAYANCTSNSTTASSSTQIFWIDNVKPLLSGARFDGGNMSYHKDNVTGQFNWTDSNLYQLNVTVDGSQVFGVFNIAATTYIYNLSIDVSAYSPGMHNITLRMTDSHTATELSKDYSVSKPVLGDEMTFYKGDEYLTISSKDNNQALNPFEYKKEVDRYTFTFNPGIEQETYIFEIRSSKQLHIVDRPDLPWHKWLVTDNQWIDFYNPDEPNMKVDIKQSEPNQAEVTISNLISPLKQVYHSVGDLNIETTSYSFISYNVTITYQNPVIETSSEWSSMYVNFGYSLPPMPQVLFTGTLAYNGSSIGTSMTWDLHSITYNSTIFYAPTVESYQQQVNGLWTLASYLANATIPWTNNVTRIILDNCSALSNTTSINITFYDENTPTQKLITESTVAFDYWITPTQMKNTSFSSKNKDSYAYCINPSTTIYVNAYWRYTSTDGFTHRYYLYNQSIGPSILYIKAYNTNTTSGYSDLRGTARNSKDYNYFFNIVGKLERFYVDENIWRTVQMDLSDDFGLLFFNIKEETQDYRIKFYDQQNNLLSTTQVMKFTCDPDLTGNKVCNLIFLITPLSSSSVSPGLVINESFDNTTRMINVSWNDYLGLTHSFRLLVTKEVMSGTTTICDTTINQTNGSVSCNVTGYEGSLYVRLLSSASPERNVLAYYIDLGRQTLESMIGRKEGAFWAGGIVSCIVLAGLWNPGAAVVAVVIGVYALFALGLVSTITISIIVMLAVIAIVIGLIVRRGYG